MNSRKVARADLNNTLQGLTFAVHPDDQDSIERLQITELIGGSPHTPTEPTQPDRSDCSDNETTLLQWPGMVELLPLRATTPCARMSWHDTGCRNASRGGRDMERRQ